METKAGSKKEKDGNSGATLLDLLERPATRRVLYFALFTLLGIFFASQTIAFAYADAIKGNVGKRIATQITDWYIYGTLSLGIIWFVRRRPVRWNFTTIAVHLAMACAFALFKAFWCWALEFVFPWMPPDPLRPLLIGEFHGNFMYYWIVVGTVQGLDYYRAHRERELRASQLETRLANAQLELLRTQLHPHFFFNTLNSIAALMHEDVEAADLMIARLSALLRRTVDANGSQEVALGEELDFLERYVEIQRTRYQERLGVTWSIDQDTRAARVPSLFLQPIVENAIRHGIDSRENGGSIEIFAHLENGRLHVGVRDDGPGLAATLNAGGLGLANTRARLEHLYGDAQALTIRNQPNGGACVEIHLPYRAELLPA